MELLSRATGTLACLAAGLSGVCIPAWAAVARSSDSFALSDGASLTTVQVGLDWCIGGWVGYGDFDGDGKTDLHCLADRGNLWRSHSTGTSLLSISNGREGWCRNGRTGFGDFDGDGRADLHCQGPDGGQAWKLSRDPPIYHNGVRAAESWCSGGRIAYGDFNGDGKTDLHCAVGDTGQHWVGLSNGTTGYLTSVQVASNWCANGQIEHGDFNGDGRADLHCRIGGQHWWGLSRLSAEGLPTWLRSVPVSSNWCANGEIGYGDFNGDGRTDLHCRSAGGNHWLAPSQVSSRGDPLPFQSVAVATGWCADGQIGYGEL